MELKGNIRRSSNGVDIAFPHDGHWHSLTPGTLRTHIEHLYEFLLSSDSQRTMFGRTFTKNRQIFGGQTRTTTKAFTPFAVISLTRFSTDMSGNNSPSDKVSISLDIATIRGGPLGNTSGMLDSDI